MKRLTRRARLSLLLGLALSLAIPGEVRPQAPARQPVFPAETELVVVDVVVSDRAGEPVVGLARDDFAVSEDGVPQELTSFEAVHRLASDAGAASPPAETLRVSTNRTLPGQEPASFVIVFDELHLTPAEAVRAREAVTSFLETGVRDGDRVAVIGSAEGTRWSAAMPEGKPALVQAVARLSGKRVGESVRDAMSEYEAMRIDQDRDPIVTDQVMRRFLATGEIRQDSSLPGEPADYSTEVDSWRSLTQARAAQVYARTSALAEQTLGVVERCLEALGGARGRKSLVLVSGGLVQDSRLRGFRQVVSESRRVNAAVYSLDVRGLVGAYAGLDTEVGAPADIIERSTGAWLGETNDASEGSRGLALDTGGFVVENRNDLGAGFARIGEEARSYYLLGYVPTNRAADGRFRQVSVKLARPDLVVRARRGYFAPGGGDTRKAPEPRDTAIQKALDAPFDLPEIPLRALAQSFAAAEPGKTTVRLTTEADIRAFAFDETAGAARDTLEFLLLVARRDTGEYTRFDQQFEMAFQRETRLRYERSWFPITRELPLAPGPYQAKIVVRDKNAGRVGSLTHEFDVPAAAGLRVSSLVLSDRAKDDGPAQARGPVPTARRTFAASGLLHCAFEVYGAARDAASGAPSVTAGFAIRRRDGRVLAAAPETPLRAAADGSLNRRLGVPLDGAPPGAYEVIVLVTDLVAGQVAEMREPILIEAPAAARP